MSDSKTRMVMLYVVGDGYSYSSDVVLPVLIDNPSSVHEHFAAAVHIANGDGTYKERQPFLFGNHTLSPEDFIVRGTYYPPEFLTVDEWFARIEG